MINQYFIFKIKDEYLPDIISKYIKEEKIHHDHHDNVSYYDHIYCIDQKYFRKLKIQNIENSISEDDKKVLEFLINMDLVKMLTQEEYNEKIKTSGSYWGTTGVSGSAGCTGVSGVSGSAGYVGLSTTHMLLWPVQTIAQPLAIERLYPISIISGLTSNMVTSINPSIPITEISIKESSKLILFFRKIHNKWKRKTPQLTPY